jgi:hypothetical protein
MTTEFDIFKSNLNYSSGIFSFPKVEAVNDFNYTVLFAIISPNLIPDKFADFVYQVFEKYNFFVEFHYLTTDGLQRNTLGYMKDIILNYKFFKNEQDFNLANTKKDTDFSINIVFTLQDFEIHDWFLCNLTSKDWFDKLRKLVYDKLQQY